MILEVEKIGGIGEVKWTGWEQNITLIGKDMDEAYLSMLKSLSVYPEVVAKQHDLKIVYTPIHGTGITLVPEILKRFGFTNVHIVEEQATPDGNFPTVVYPNPEESEAMSIGLKKAAALDADILLGTDPDSDRVGIAVKDHTGKWILLNGNQTAVLLFNYIVEARKRKRSCPAQRLHLQNGGDQRPDRCVRRQQQYYPLATPSPVSSGSRT